MNHKSKSHSNCIDGVGFPDERQCPDDDFSLDIEAGVTTPAVVLLCGNWCREKRCRQTMPVFRKKYEYLIDLGKKHEPLSEAYKTEEYALEGCQSQVWIQAELVNGRVYLAGDSDSMITKGMLALAQRVLNGWPPDVIAKADIYFTEKTGLSTNLSPARANGLETIIRNMREKGERLIRAEAL